MCEGTGFPRWAILGRQNATSILLVASSLGWGWFLLAQVLTYQGAFMMQGYDILYKDKTRMRSTCNSTSRPGSISFIGLALTLTFATLYCVIFGPSFDRIRELVGGQVTVWK